MPTTLLELAPSRVIEPRLRRLLGDGYRSADLFMAGVDDRVDLCAMGYPDESFDWLICSHVLEHVPDDVAAMAEIRRVLRPGGRAVLLVPISRCNDVIDEDPGVTGGAARLARFGQDDHVRVYNRAGFVERLQRAGLTVEVVDLAALGAMVAPAGTGRELSNRFALPPTAALYVVRP